MNKLSYNLCKFVFKRFVSSAYFCERTFSGKIERRPIALTIFPNLSSRNNCPPDKKYYKISITIITKKKYEVNLPSINIS